MKEKILFYYKETKKITDKIHPSILAASLVYFLLLVAIPMINFTLLTLSKIGIINGNDFFTIKKHSIISLIMFIINIIYVTSKIVHILKRNMESIYQTKFSNNPIISRLKSMLLLSALFLLLIIEILIEVFIFNILEITEIPYFLRNILQIFLRFAFIVFFLSILLKKIIPIKVKLIRMLYLSSIITLLSFIVIKVYLWLYNYFGTDNMQNLYGNLYQVFLLVVLIYIIMNIFIYSIIFEYITYKLGKNEYNNIEHERGV